jgi:serine/threonine-protein phosphatase 2B regulatory subunit
MSFGLTQYDVEELIAFCDGKCMRGGEGRRGKRGSPRRPRRAHPTLPLPFPVSQPEIEGLYRRFRALDKGRKGYISADEFLAIPELSINPLARRLERLFECVNFREFVGFLAAFSARATKEDRVKLIFAVFDADGDGRVGRDDLDLVLRQLAGSSLSEDEVAAALDAALARAPAGALTLDDFRNALAGRDLAMAVDVPLAD